jgi:general stress protein 26
MAQHLNKAEVEARLWSEIGKARYGMLGLVGAGAGGHFQPMTAFTEPDASAIWFFARKSSDLAGRLEGGGEAMFIIQAKDQEFQACMGGRLAADHDPARIGRYWNAVVAAWYPEGKDDPDLTLLRLDVRDAQVWLSEGNPVAFGFQISKANVTGREPDVGQSTHLDLGRRP